MSESSKASSGKPLRCTFGMHKWAKRTNDEGVRYRECVRRGKKDNIPDSAGPRTTPG